jgi:hypothetical protein
LNEASRHGFRRFSFLNDNRSGFSEMCKAVFYFVD